MDLGSKDLISNLPDDLVCHILSFLTTKQAALTSVLSKRWRYLLAFVPNLQLYGFIPYDYWKRRKKFVDFVNRVLALQGNASINKFSLGYEITEVDQEHVNGWISNVLDRGIVELDLDIFPTYRLPSKVLVSKTLVRLKVRGTSKFSFDEGEVFLPKLKTLHLDYKSAFQPRCLQIAELISGCPVLEELVIETNKWFLSGIFPVSSPSLKRLMINSRDKDFPKSASFDTPNLVYLEYTGCVALKYPIVNFDSLIKARLDLRMQKSADATCFIMGMRNVKILYLSDNTLEALSFGCKVLPVFNNLIHLTIETIREVGWKSLPNLLKNCPNLETLVFDVQYEYGVNVVEKSVCKPWESTRLFLSSSKVKNLKVLNCGDAWGDINKQTEVIKYLLETMPNLEQVTLYYGTRFHDDVSKVTVELQNLEKLASPICKIQIVPSIERSYSWRYGLDRL